MGEKCLETGLEMGNGQGGCFAQVLKMSNRVPEIVHVLFRGLIAGICRRNESIRAAAKRIVYAYFENRNPALRSCFKKQKPESCFKIPAFFVAVM